MIGYAPCLSSVSPGSIEHRAQVILYTLLMSDRYSQAVDAGLLFYMKSAHMLSDLSFSVQKQCKRVFKRVVDIGMKCNTSTLWEWHIMEGNITKIICWMC